MSLAEFDDRFVKVDPQGYRSMCLADGHVTSVCLEPASRCEVVTGDRYCTQHAEALVAETRVVRTRPS